MYVIAGLGNPGKKYENTRHNMGFITVDQLAIKHDIKVDKLKFKALVGEGRIAGQKVLLVKPQTYMNLSGESIRQVMHFYKLDPEKLIVIYDDIDIELGALRIRKFGSAGTHNGMKSVVYQLQSDRFPRIRIGIGSQKKGDLVDFVIGGFSKEEVPVLEETVTKAVSAIECILEEDVDIAMNRYNTKKARPKKEEHE
ncbi:aminoacyl-tRNA hydrolase [Anaerovoracaceae bacterium 41-7]|jgi:PTH1 family peptidyl-tRNA hydrolase|uniref:Peptidyl-tRNA hydrolase n=1 Tax=Anaerotruncus colihominis TaxID=169435 RepID=A0A845QKQ9_9FIRM|nr:MULTISPECIES: aminoacyl-tRNA hydrolase [Clostridia]MCI9477008.1 aminoacyl-tRNA hydrolase [Emergencia sp.]NBH62792.1 aminoacyl-tRNA hydrolase [Anaerotruncus colihominis]NCE97772.1 aminoacyl-tRNA hydrolase [Emergencia sp. 1XD21-10]NCF03446.1 aminoacyl-tRNA hydrolase [Anaerotruncus sp. 80]